MFGNGFSHTDFKVAQHLLICYLLAHTPSSWHLKALLSAIILALIPKGP